VAQYGSADILLFLQLTSPTIDSAYSSVALHPDGQILGTGTDDAVVHVWETRSQNVRHNCITPRLCYATTVLRHDCMMLLANLLVFVHDGIVAAQYCCQYCC